MALTLATVLTAARDKDSALTRTRAPDAVLARDLTGYQRRLISQAADLDSNFVAQQCSIIFAASTANVPTALAAGSQGGGPADASQPARIALTYQDSGPAIEVDVNSNPLIADALVTSATTIAVTVSGANWQVNRFVNQWLWCVAGPAAGQLRQILSNTIDTLVISTGTDLRQFAVVPGPTDLIRVVAANVDAAGGSTVLTEITPTQSKYGFLVSLDANGRPYINPTIPLVATFDRGIFVPPYERIIGGTVRLNSGLVQDDITIRPYRMRYQWGPSYTVWIESGQVFLAGAASDWRDVASIDLRYVPIPPAFQALTDYFLLDDDCYDVMSYRAAYVAGQRVKKLADVGSIDVMYLKEEWQAAEQNFLSSVGAHNRAFPTFVKDSW
jgi:hypothetical protein